MPMKGYSERIPNKNLKDFNGKPLFHHVLQSLQDCPLIDVIVINTDSEEIAKSAEATFDKVRIHKRPKDICGDYVSMNDIIAFDLEKLEADVYLQTHSTNPLLQSETISKAIDEFINQDQFDSMFSVNRLQTRLYLGDMSPVNHSPNELLRTQDLPPLFEENSNIFLFSKKSFNAAGNKRIGLKPMMFEMDKLESIDIDEPQDFLLAESIQRLKLV